MQFQVWPFIFLYWTKKKKGIYRICSLILHILLTFVLKASQAKKKKGKRKKCIYMSEETRFRLLYSESQALEERKEWTLLGYEWGWEEKLEVAIKEKSFGTQKTKANDKEEVTILRLYSISLQPFASPGTRFLLSPRWTMITCPHITPLCCCENQMWWFPQRDLKIVQCRASILLLLWFLGSRILLSNKTKPEKLFVLVVFIFYWLNPIWEAAMGSVTRN